MSTQKVVQGQFQINVNSFYIESESDPEKSYYFFAYKVTIKNVGSSPAQLMHRYWHITDAHGRVEEVRGPGVVGLQPKINPGQTFEYESACPLQTNTGCMRGSYQMHTDQGSAFDVEIPEFYLICPSALN